MKLLLALLALLFLGGCVFLYMPKGKLEKQKPVMVKAPCQNSQGANKCQ